MESEESWDKGENEDKNVEEATSAKPTNKSYLDKSNPLG
jgi:hypothetical protein